MASTKLHRHLQRSIALCALGLLASTFASSQERPVGFGSGLSGSAQPQFDRWELRAQDNTEMYIPPTADRPLDPTAGPRIQVATIGLDIDRKLATKMSVELNESIKLRLVGEVAENRAQGFTIGRLENAAVDITEMLRDAGFILAWAYLPEQDVQDETVSIVVLPGSLDTITADGNGRYSTARLLAPFDDLLGAPVDRDSIERSIMYLRDYPGLDTTAVFGPGMAVGSSELTLRVTEDPFDIGFVADNHGTRTTGEARLRADLLFYNPFGRADSLTAIVLQTFDPADNLYGAIAYETPIFTHDLALGVSYSQNTFDIGSGDLADFGLGGDTDIGSIYLKKTMQRSRLARVDLSLDMSVKSAVLNGTNVPNEDNLSVATLGLSVESVDQFLSGGINQLQIGYARGIADFLGSMDEFGLSGNGAISTRIGGSGAQAGGDFGKTMLRYQRLQRVSASNSILFRLEAQQSSDLLTSIEQFVMGGPNNVRAYPIAEYLMDKGQFVSVEWIVDLLQLFGDGGTNGSFSISAFGDYAHGEVNDPFGDQNPDVDLAGVGIGIAIGHTSNGGNQFSFSIDVSQASTQFEPTNDRDPQYFGLLSYTFR